MPNNEENYTKKTKFTFVKTSVASISIIPLTGKTHFRSFKVIHFFSPFLIFEKKNAYKTFKI